MFSVVILFTTIYAFAATILIVGSVNVMQIGRQTLWQFLIPIYFQRQRICVLSFLIVDSVFSLILTYFMFLNAFYIIPLFLQLYSSLFVYSFWQQLQQERKTRNEMKVVRARQDRVQKDIPKTLPLAEIASVAEPFGSFEHTVISW